MTVLRNVWKWLTDDPHHRTGLRVLQFAIGALLLFRVFTEARFAAYLWGPDGLGWGSISHVVGPELGALLDRAFATQAGTVGVLFALTLSGLGLVLGYQTRLASAVALVAFYLLQSRLPELGDGGDNLAQLALTYMVFALPAGAKPARGSVAVWLHNIAVVAIIAQVMVLYATSGMMKAFGDKWHYGVAMYYISQVAWFSEPAMRGMFKNPLITLVSTYVPMFYQVLFPVAIFSRVKLAWLALGVVFHLGIAVFMGLVTFSAVMIGAELFLITDDEYVWLRGRVQAAWDRLTTPLTQWRATRANPTLGPALQLYIDGYCPHCRAAGQTIERLDQKRGRIDVTSFRHNVAYRAHGLDAADLERRMHVVDLHSGRVWSGFEAVRAVVAAIPRLWPARPLLALAAWIGLGDRMYDVLAARRQIIPDARACEGTCELPALRQVQESAQG